MSKLISKLKEETTKTYTENGALTYSTSLNHNVDFFFMGSASSQQSLNASLNLFINAYKENKDMALANLYYLRDIRNGQGVRNVAQNIYKWLAENDTVDLNKLVEYGYYKDLLYLLETKLKNQVLQFIKNQLRKDEQSDNPSLLAKWLPSWSPHGKTNPYAKMIVDYMFSCSKQYRKLLKKLRDRINIVETKITNKLYQDIDYSKVPAKAMMKYQKCFLLHDRERYETYLDMVQKGEDKINTATLYPADIVKKILKGETNTFLDVAWDNLKNVFEDKQENSLVMCDVSGSMYGTPITVSISLAMYIAERNKGIFHNTFLRFSNKPYVCEIKGNTLKEKIDFIKGDDFGGSTNILGAFQAVLSTALKANLSEDEMPKRIYIISDMEFDEACSYHITTFDEIKRMYEEAGYKAPQIIFWNVDSRHKNVPVRFNENGVALISGYSPNILKSLLGETDINPEKVMLKALSPYLPNSEAV